MLHRVHHVPVLPREGGVRGGVLLPLRQQRLKPRVFSRLEALMLQRVVPDTGAAQLPEHADL